MLLPPSFLHLESFVCNIPLLMKLVSDGIKTTYFDMFRLNFAASVVPTGPPPLAFGSGVVVLESLLAFLSSLCFLI